MSNVLYMTYTPQTDEERRRGAELQYADLYDALSREAQRKTDALAGRKRAQEAQMEETFGLRAQEVAETFGEQRRQVEQAALDRGFGRSSYVTDRIGRSFELQDASLAQLQREKAQRVSDLELQIDDLYAALFEDQAHLTQEKANKILSAIDGMRQEQEKTAREVQQYNNDLTLRTQAADAARQKEQRDYELAMQRLAEDRAQALRDYELASRQAEQNAQAKQEQLAWQRAQAEEAARQQALDRALREWELQMKYASSIANIPAVYAPAPSSSSSSSSSSSAKSSAASKSASSAAQTPAAKPPASGGGSSQTYLSMAY